MALYVLPAVSVPVALEVFGWNPHQMSKSTTCTACYVRILSHASCLLSFEVSHFAQGWLWASFVCCLSSFRSDPKLCRSEYKTRRWHHVRFTYPRGLVFFEVQRLLAFHTWHLGGECECRDDLCIDFLACCVQVSFLFKDHSRAWTIVTTLIIRTTLMASCNTHFSATRVSGLQEWLSQSNPLHNAFLDPKKCDTLETHCTHTHTHTMTHASWFILVAILGLLLEWHWVSCYHHLW